MFISGYLFKKGIWEPSITMQVQRELTKYPQAMFLNIGANIGYYSLLAASMGHHVIAGW